MYIQISRWTEVYKSANSSENTSTNASTNTSQLQASKHTAYKTKYQYRGSSNSTVDTPQPLLHKSGQSSPVLPASPAQCSPASHVHRPVPARSRRCHRSGRGLRSGRRPSRSSRGHTRGSRHCHEIRRPIRSASGNWASRALSSISNALSCAVHLKKAKTRELENE